jgi:hypothetical protein
MVSCINRTIWPRFSKHLCTKAHCTRRHFLYSTLFREFRRIVLVHKRLFGAGRTKGARSSKPLKSARWRTGSASRRGTGGTPFGQISLSPATNSITEQREHEWHPGEARAHFQAANTPSYALDGSRVAARWNKVRGPPTGAGHGTRKGYCLETLPSTQSPRPSGGEYSVWLSIFASILFTTIDDRLTTMRRNISEHQQRLIQSNSLKYAEF